MKTILRTVLALFAVAIVVAALAYSRPASADVSILTANAGGVVSQYTITRDTSGNFHITNALVTFPTGDGGVSQAYQASAVIGQYPLNAGANTTVHTWDATAITLAKSQNGL